MSTGTLFVSSVGKARPMFRFVPESYPSSAAKDAGMRWEGQAWTSLAAFDIFRALSERFPELSCDFSFTQWLHGWMDRRVEISTEFTRDLFDFQVKAVAFLVRNAQHGAMLAMAPGLGKTACAIRAAAALGRKHILVVAPLSLLYNWKKEIVRWGGDYWNSISICHGELEEAYSSQWMITNYDTLKKFRPGGYFDQIIVDESVIVKNRFAQRTAAVATWVRKALAATGSVWLLSGAPTTRFYDDLWAQLNIIDSQRFSSYWRFARRYCYVEETIWGMAVAQNWPDSAEKLKLDLMDIYFSRKQEDVLDLPEFLEERIDVPMGKLQSKMYKSMEETFLVQLSKEPADQLIAPTVLAQMTRLLQLASSPYLVGYASKINAKQDALLDLLERAELPVIAWTNYIETARVLQETFANLRKPGAYRELVHRYTTAVLTGATEVAHRQQIVDDFQAGKIDVLIAHPGVGKFGLTLTKARTAYYLERSFMGDDYYQSLHRIRRIGMSSERPVVVHLLATTYEGSQTIDHVIDRVLASRVAATRSLTSAQLYAELTGGGFEQGKAMDIK